MREVIEIDKDFNLDSTKFSKKYKNNSNIKGKVNISLFDTKGNKQREIFTENKIMEWVKDEAYYTRYECMLGKNQNIQSIFQAPEASNAYSTLAKFMLLSDVDLSEDEITSTTNRGNIIGYAQRKTTYSGSSLLKGSYNEVESSIYVNDEGNIVCHEVYDFPTHACNGDINSIMWTHEYDETLYQNRYVCDKFRESRGTSFNAYQNAYFDFDRRELYYFLSNTMYKAYSYNIKNQASELIIEIKPPCNTSWNSNIKYYFDIHDKNDIRVYVSNTTTSTYNTIPANSLGVIKYDFEGNILDTEVYSIPSLSSHAPANGGSYTVNQAYLYNEHIYLYLSANGYIYLAQCDKKGQLLRCVEVEKASVNSKGLYIRDNEVAIQTSNNYNWFDFNLNRINRNSSNYGTNVSNARNFIIRRYSSDTLMLGTINIPFTTYVKLPNTVTKTSTQTMKVQYDFVIEKNKVADYLGDRIR